MIIADYVRFINLKISVFARGVQELEVIPVRLKWFGEGFIGKVDLSLGLDT